MPVVVTVSLAGPEADNETRELMSIETEESGSPQSSTSTAAGAVDDDEDDDALFVLEYGVGDAIGEANIANATA
jgi:hypothetical protein